LFVGWYKANIAGDLSDSECGANPILSL
jgi:hypothetical protein